jgi:hypothetical protein
MASQAQKERRVECVESKSGTANEITNRKRKKTSAKYTSEGAIAEEVITNRVYSEGTSGTHNIVANNRMKEKRETTQGITRTTKKSVRRPRTTDRKLQIKLRGQ